MLRSGLGKKIHPASSPRHLSGGAFSVPKDLDRDRFIGDRRPRNGTEQLIGRCHLPWASRLRRRMLPSGCVTRTHFRDASDCHYACSVDEKMLQRQSWARESRCLGSAISTMRVSICCPLMGSNECPVILSRTQHRKKLTHVDIARWPWRRSSWAI